MRNIVPFAVLALAPTASAQIALQWSATHDGAAQTDLCYGVAVDSNDHVAVTGRSYNATSGSPPPPPTADIETAVYDAAGTLLWSRRFDGTLHGDDVGYAIAFDLQGNLIVGGQSAGYSGANYLSQRTVLKYDSAGTLLWSTQTGATAGPNGVRALVVDAAGSIYVCGTDGGTGSGDLCVAKLDASGNELWVARVDGSASGYDYGYDVKLGPGGDVWACGYLVDTGTGQDMALVRIDATGNVVWTRTVNGSANGTDAAYSLAVDALGYAYVAGSTASTSTGLDARVVKYDAAGNIQWSWIQDGPAHGDDVVRKIALDPFGRLVVAANEKSATTGTFFDVRVLGSDSTTIWEAIYDSPGDDTLRGLCLDAQGNVTVAGYGTDLAALGTGADAVCVGYDSTGRERFVHVFSANGAAGASQRWIDVAQMGIGTFALAGYSDAGGNTSTDYLVARIDRTSRGFCFGDGSYAACPCANESEHGSQAGCLNSLGSPGRIVDQGASSIANDTLVLAGSGMPSSSVLYFQGTLQQSGGAGTAFGDGLRCAAGSVTRLGTKTNDGTGSSHYPAAGDPSVSVKGFVTAPGQRTYQVWYRNPAAFCTASTFNLSNGLLVTWIP